MTVLKRADDKGPQLAALEALRARPDVDDRTRKRIDEETWAVRAGIEGERQAAYEIDFHFAARDGYAVIHDLRIEFEGRVAQIDHLLINRILDVWVCETKAFSQGVKIDENGEWYRYAGKFALGMASPVKQNARHVEVLRDVFDKGAVKMPRRLGLTLKPAFHPVVLISNDAKIHRPRSKADRDRVAGLDTVIKIERLIERIDQSFDERNPVRLLARIVSKETVRDLATQLISLHRPAQIDWAARFGLSSEPATSEPPAVAAQPEPAVAPVEAHPSATCANCGRSVSPKVAAYSLEHTDEFGGRVLCFDCQRAERRSRRRRAS